MGQLTAVVNDEAEDVLSTFCGGEVLAASTALKGGVGSAIGTAIRLGRSQYA